VPSILVKSEQVSETARRFVLARRLEKNRRSRRKEFDGSLRKPELMGTNKKFKKKKVH